MLDGAGAVAKLQRGPRPASDNLVVHRRLRLAVTALAVTATLCSPAAAHAERWAGSDPEADVEGRHFTPEPPPCGTYTEVDASGNTNQDITRLVVSHQRREVRLIARFRELDREVEQRVAVHLTTGKRRWFLDVNRFRDFDADVFQVSAFLARGPYFPAGGDECGAAVVARPTSCHVRPELDLRANVLRASVPRSCLRNPRWVRVGARATGAGTNDERVGYSDEWGSSESPLPPFGPKVSAPRGAKVGAHRP